MTFHEEQTETMYLSVLALNNKTDYLAEVFIKDNGFVWYAVLRYNRLPRKSAIIRDTYESKVKSLRPYRAGQACDGSITSCVYHLYNQLCHMMGIDPLETYREAYDDHILTQDQFYAILAFAEWQGVETILEWNAQAIDLVIDSIREAKMHQLANLLEAKIPA